VFWTVCVKFTIEATSSRVLIWLFCRYTFSWRSELRAILLGVVGPRLVAVGLIENSLLYSLGLMHPSSCFVPALLF